MKDYYNYLVVCLLVSLSSYAQVGIGTTTPNGALEVTSTTDGMLIPRIALVNTVTATITTPTISEMVYNTATINDVTPGFYYWDGVKWVRVATGTNNDWALAGNSLTVAGINYIGTSDGVDLRVKTGGTDRWNISNANNGQLQSYSLGSAATPVYSYQGDQDTGIFSPGANALGLSTNGTEKARVTPAGQVAIGTTLPQGAIDIVSTTNGVVIPRVALTNRSIAAPVVNPQGGLLANGTMIYNTATVTIAAGNNSITPGFYYWRSGKWYRKTDLVIANYYYPPTDILPNTVYTLTGTTADGDFFDGATVTLSGDWAATPNVTIEYVETRTGSVRFKIRNNTIGTTYLGMDFIITTFKY